MRPLIVATLVGVALGLLSLLGDGVLRLRLFTLVGNLATPWAVPAFLVGRLATSRRFGALAGGLVLLTGVATYYGVWILRGYPLVPAVVMWTVVALTMGPVMGLCGAASARCADWPPVVAVAAPAAVALAEATYFVLNRRVWLWDFAVHPHRFVDLSVLVGLLAVGLLLPAWLVRPRRRLRVVYPVAFGTGLVGAGALALLYRLLVALPGVG